MTLRRQALFSGGPPLQKAQGHRSFGRQGRRQRRLRPSTAAPFPPHAGFSEASPPSCKEYEERGCPLGMVGSSSSKRFSSVSWPASRHRRRLLASAATPRAATTSPSTDAERAAPERWLPRRRCPLPHPGTRACATARRTSSGCSVVCPPVPRERHSCPLRGQKGRDPPRWLSG